jgi:hypothetical protein
MKKRRHSINPDECRAAGIDPKIVNSLARRLQSITDEAEVLGITLFGGAGGGSLRFRPKSASKVHDPLGALILASVSGPWDGGDGGYGPATDGLIRGETDSRW